MYRVIETGRKSQLVHDLDLAVSNANGRIADWPSPFDNLRNHHQFEDFRRFGVHRLAVQSADKTRTIAIERTWR